MRKVGLKTLKNKLSEYVRLAAAGETIAITDRDRIVAEIVPPLTPSGLTPFEEQGVREGWLRPARLRDGSPPPSKPVPGLTLEQLLSDLARDREDQ
jgi:antitoxin (DNA-binding transcriptional repressor) of toxin-antitoxin stability system